MRAIRCLLLLALVLGLIAPGGCQRKTTRKVEYKGPDREIEVKVEHKDGDRHDRRHHERHDDDD